MITHSPLIASNLPIKLWLLGDGQQVCTDDLHMLDLLAEKGRLNRCLIPWNINRVVPKSCIIHSIHVHNTNIYSVNMGLQYSGLLPMCALSEFLPRVRACAAGGKAIGLSVVYRPSSVSMRIGKSQHLSKGRIDKWDKIM